MYHCSIMKLVLRLFLSIAYYTTQMTISYAKKLEKKIEQDVIELNYY